MLFNALVIVVDVVIAARVTMGVPVLRGGRDFRDCWSQLGIAVFFLLYSVIGVTALVLMLRHVRSGPEPDEATADDADVRVPELTY